MNFVAKFTSVNAETLGGVQQHDSVLATDLSIFPCYYLCPNAEPCRCRCINGHTLYFHMHIGLYVKLHSPCNLDIVNDIATPLLQCKQNTVMCIVDLM